MWLYGPFYVVVPNLGWILDEEILSKSGEDLLDERSGLLDVDGWTVDLVVNLAIPIGLLIVSRLGWMIDFSRPSRNAGYLSLAMS